MSLGSPIGEALGRYLDLASDQLKLTAANMANVDTPGYKTLGFDFEQEFARQLNAVPGLDGAAGLNGGTDPQVSMVEGLVARPDGNNVAMDREGLELAKAQMRFRLGVALLKGEFSQVMSAIHADGK
jgi:flagellar basal-body rod protein FlgB